MVNKIYIKGANCLAILFVRISRIRVLPHVWDQTFASVTVNSTYFDEKELMFSNAAYILTLK